MPRNDGILIRSGTVSPTASDFVIGEPAFDKSAGLLYIKTAAGVMAAIGGGGGSSGIVEAVSASAFPGTGTAGILYIATDSRRIYTWATSVYVELGPVGGSDSANWALFLPTSPTSVVATGGNAQASLVWSAPTGLLSQTPITDYVVQYSSNSGTTWTTFSDGVATSASATVTGLANSTAYTFRVAASNMIGTGSWSSSSNAVTPSSGDAYFGQVALLLKGDAMVDSSDYARTVTASGATISTSQAKFGTGSIYIAGSGYVSVPSDSIDLSGDFAVEFWVRLANGSSQQWVFGGDANANGYFMAGFNLTGAGQFWVGKAAVGWPLQFSGLSIANDTWTHVAFSRLGSSNRLYVNGAQVGSTITDSTAWVVNPSGLMIGNQTAGAAMNGYLDDIRITTTTAREYTGATIPVATSSLPDSGPQGFDSHWSQVSLMLHMDGASFVDSSPTPKAITVYGDAAQSSVQSKWGGKSLLIDSASKYLSIPSAGITFTGDFALECWVYMTGSANSYVLLEGRSNTSAYEDFVWYLHNGGYHGFVTAGGGGARLDGTTALIPQNQWTHIAIARSGGVIRAFVNGVRDATMVSYSGTITAASSTLKIGSNGSQGFSGYIDDYRITAGSGRGYVGATYSVPAATFQDSGPYVPDPYYADVSLLLHSNGTSFVDSSSSPKAITGSATLSATQSKWGGKSAIFDGSGSSLSVANSASLNLSGVDWAVEAWLYPTSNPQYTCVIGKRSGSNPTSWYCMVQYGVVGFYNGSSAYTQSGSISTDAWTHVAWSMTSGTLRIYVGGVRVGEWSSVSINEVDVPVEIGSHYSSLTEAFAGFIDDIRVTKNSSRGYVGATLVIPSSQLQDS